MFFVMELAKCTLGDMIKEYKDKKKFFPDKFLTKLMIEMINTLANL